MAWPRNLLGRTGRFLQRKLDRAYYHACGREERPVFYDVDRTYPPLRVIDRNYDVIREELLAILPRRDGMPRYHEVDAKQDFISGSTPGSWRTFFLSIYGAGERLPNRSLCPRTVAILDSIPNLLQAFFSILDPGKTVPAHRGPHLYSLRYHTAFVVPQERPPRIRVKDQFYTWSEKESLLFDDSWEHEVLNESQGVRVVLVTDVIRPRPKLLEHPLRLALDVSVAGAPREDWDAYFEQMMIR